MNILPDSLVVTVDVERFDTFTFVIDSVTLSVKACHWSTLWHQFNASSGVTSCKIIYA